MKILTLSFLTESKVSHACLSSIRQVAITLLVMLLTTASAWAQFFPQTKYYLYLNENYQGGGIGTVEVPISEPTTTYTLASYDEPTREGYVFFGWSTSSTGPVEYKTGDQVKLTGNQTLYAVWGKNPYIITLNSSYDGGAVKSILVSSIDPTYTLTSNDEPTREGYMFCGWSTSSTGDVQYRTNDQITLDGNLTLYAVWDDNPYIITLNTNYDGGVVKSILVPRNYPNYTLTSNDEPAREGYMFYGWSTSSTGGVEYKTGDPVTSTGNLTLYAVWYKLTYTITNEEKKQVELSGYEKDNPEGTLNIPATVTINGIEYSVTSIGENAFENCDNLQSVTIPNSVTSIGMYAFRNCSSLQSVTIPNSVTSIGIYAFSGCSNLQSVAIPNSVTSIGMYAFSGCSNLQSVTIPNSVTSIGHHAFLNCEKLESVTIPNSVTSIERGTFENCRKLTSVTLNSNPKIGDDAFLGTPATVTMNLTASEIDGDYWTTFYNDNWEYNFEADGNTTVYKGTVNESSLVLTEVEDKIVNSGTAVILKSSGKPVMTLTGSGSSDTNDNDLRGISDRTKRTSVISNFSANEIYTMGNTSAGFGFHRYTGEYVPAGKAFLPLYIENEAGAKAQSLIIVYANETTGINSVSSDSNVQNDWFTLDGTRLSGKPTLPGIYINGKKKIAIK